MTSQDVPCDRRSARAAQGRLVFAHDAGCSRGANPVGYLVGALSVQEISGANLLSSDLGYDHTQAFVDQMFHQPNRRLAVGI
jgi:hypothetical protein